MGAVGRGDLVQDPADPVGGIDRVLEAFVDLLAGQDRERAGRLLEELLDQAPPKRVALLLERVDPWRVGAQLDRSDHRPDALDDHVARADEDGRLVDGARRRRRHVVEDEQVADLLGEVDDVVEDAGQGMDVLALERDDERRLEVRQDGVVDVVAAMLELAQPVGGGGRVRRSRAARPPGRARPRPRRPPGSRRARRTSDPSG